MVGDLDDDVVVRDQILVPDVEAVAAGLGVPLVGARLAGRALLLGTTRHTSGVVSRAATGPAPSAIRETTTEPDA